MIFFAPSPPPNYSQNAIVQLIDTIRRALLPVVTTDEAVQRIMLRSPDGKSWQVTIDNSGNLQTAVNDGKSRI